MSSPFQHSAARGSTLPFLADAIRRIHETDVFDRPAEVLRRIAEAALTSPRVRSVLRGEQIGHALHPILTDFPLGAWTSTSLLDLFGGPRARPAATGLLSFGIAAAVPTALSGLAEWQKTTGPARRVGTGHAIVNSAALALYSSSLVARLRDRHTTAVALGLAGGLMAIVGGYLGGHLSLTLKVGTTDPAMAQEGSR
ncbi:MAG TPA: DUF2231 domain-containing protein [Mycobacteriales bacterium]|jgi:uncharacterized membrane protein|nr:DUF2231 domain-containing protein [Mycobacteriales bacterium]